jgi:lipopolysaccharide/colanic/teichoic acid biosynthesis glycosyltransferase
LVQGYLEEMPEFAERHKIRPGLAGLAQLVGSYYITPRQKLRFDRIYARHAGLGFDLKLIVLSFLLVFWLRWRKNWNGRLPRTWLRFGNRLQ